MTAWSAEHQALVREHYGTKGGAWCAERVGRRIKTVSKWAAAHGIPGRPREQQAQTIATPFIDEAIRLAYEPGKPPGSVGRMAAQFGLTYSWVKDRARTLGLCTRRRDYRTWSAPEVAFVKEHAHLTPAEIARRMKAKGWKRSAAAVKTASRRMRIEPTDGFYTTATLADALGLGTTALRRYVDKALLLPERRGGSAGDYLFTEAEVARFLCNNPAVPNPLKVDLVWLIDIVARHGVVSTLDQGLKKGQRQLALAELRPDLSDQQIADMTESTPGAVQVVRSRSRQLRLPPPARDIAA